MLCRIALFLLLACAATASAGDWPQILGPYRNGQVPEEKLPDAWPRSGPPIVWRLKLGTGYAGPAIVGKQAIVFHRVGDQERVEALDVSNGRSLWKAEFPARYRGGVNEDKGPRCVPTIAQGRVFAFGAAGDLYAVDLASGRKLWVRELYDDYSGDEGYFGAGSAPLVIDGKLLVNVGGNDAGIVALDPATGKTLWKSTQDAASYAAPAPAVIEGKPWAIVVTRLNALAVDPATGETKLLTPFGKRGPTVNAATPLVVDHQIFLTASYGVGAQLVAFDGNSAKTVWANDDTLSSQYTTAVEREGFLYGCHGREDIGTADFRCVELKTGNVRWSQLGFGVAHVICAGDKLLVVKVDGEILLAAANSTNFRQVAGFVPDISGKIRALPALSGGKLFVRSTSDRGGELLCIAVDGK